MFNVIEWLSVAILFVLLCPAAHALDLNADPKAEDYYFAKGMSAPAQEREKTFLPATKRANFTAFDGVEGVAVESGKLVFTMSGPRAMLGWGNHGGLQTISEIEDMWQQTNIVRLRIKQSSGRSQWTIHQWRDGVRIGRPLWEWGDPQKTEERRTAATEIEGGDWREVTFKQMDADGANPDGLEFLIEGAKGMKFEIEWLKLIQPAYEGYCRREFMLPQGKIWRAIADVGSGNDRHWMGKDEVSARLYINGQLVPRRTSSFLYGSESVDITPYLKPGRNCVGFHGFRVKYSPVLYFQSRIAMESGEIAQIASGKDWKCSPDKAEGWNIPGFDDSAWALAKDGPGAGGLDSEFNERPFIPAYNGRLVIANPQRRDLFYSDASDVVADVRVPAGLKSKQSVLSYIFGKSDSQGACSSLKEGQASSFSEEGASIVYHLNFGRQAHGVYALALSLKSGDGSVIEERPREPLVVLRKVPQKVIEGGDYMEGLDAELEDTVDFTNLADPHPWVEVKATGAKNAPTERVTQPNIVRNGDLVYRQVTGAKRYSGFSYRIEFKHPGDFYIFEMEYPDDARRIIEVSVTHKMLGQFINTEGGTGAETGGRFLPTGTMQKMQWIQIARSGPHSIDVINCSDGLIAAAKSLKIYHVKGALPSIGAGTQRSYGVYTERCAQKSGIGAVFGPDKVALPQRPAQGPDSRALMRMFLSSLVWMEATGENYVQYLRFSGQNCHVMGCYQYHEHNTPFAPVSIPDDSRVLHCMKTMMANIFETNGIDFFAGVEFMGAHDVRTYSNNAQVANGADTIWMMDAKGDQRYNYESNRIQNWLHPKVRQSYDQVITDVANTFGHLKHFRGVQTPLAANWADYMPGFVEGGSSDPMEASYDDVTLRLFEGDTGFKVPLSQSDPMRFMKRAAFFRGPVAKRRFLDWRCAKLQSLCRDVVEQLKRKRSDLSLANAIWFERPDLFMTPAKTGKPFNEFLKEAGIDLGRLNAIEGVYNGRFTVSWRQPKFDGQSEQQDPYCWLTRTSPEYIAAFDNPANRCVYVRASWDENQFIAGDKAALNADVNSKIVESDWIINEERIEPILQPGGDHCRDAFIQAIITSDPNLLVGGFLDMGINVGYEDKLRGLFRTLTWLPREKFQPALNTGLETNLAIRRLTKGNESWFYVANPCQWSVNGSVTLETNGAVMEVASGKPVVLKGSGVPKELPISLTPYDMAAWRVSSPDLRIVSYRTDPADPADLARLQNVVNRISALVNDPLIGLSLDLKERQFVRKSMADAAAAIQSGEYARAWSLLTHWRVWANWKDHLEEASHSEPLKAPAPPKVEYDKTRNCIQVVGFPEENPATMETILAADSKNRWGKVSYNPAADTYTVDAALWIGDDQSLGMFFQIGDAKHPKTTVIMKGTVWVRPEKESVRRSDGQPSILNRLTLGSPDDKSIRTMLKFDCKSRGEHGLYVGFRSPDDRTDRKNGSLRVYNSTITAAIQDKDHAWGTRDYTGPSASPRWSSPGWYAADLRLINATISWFDGCPAYGAATGFIQPLDPMDLIRPSGSGVIEGTTFEHGGAALTNLLQFFKNCVFRDLDTAVGGGGGFGGTFVNCVFENNRLNWALGGVVARYIVLTDCQVGRSESPIALRKNKITLEEQPKVRRPIYPACIERQSLLVKVVDAAGAPVPSAFIAVSCKDDPEQVIRGVAATNEKGLTPSDPEADAIVIATRKLQATNNPDQPKTFTYGYEITATKDGFKTATAALPAGQPIPRPLTIQLGK